MIQLQKMTKYFGSQKVFDEASCIIPDRARVGLVGPNGSGKSTLLKILMGKEDLESGSIIRSKNMRMGYLAQDLGRASEKSVIENVVSEDMLLHAHEREASLTIAKAKRILVGLGFLQTDFDRPLTELSGGWLMRTELARLLVEEPDFLLLDEPTNHLDLESLLWLEDFLTRYSGSILVISHDTEFLNRLINQVIEIDQKQLWSYAGNLDSFVVQKEQRLSLLRSQARNQEVAISHMMSFVERFRYKASKARQAQSRLKQIEKMERIELPDENRRIEFRFPQAPHSGKETLFVEKASFGYTDDLIFRDLEWIIPRGSRTAIVGMNGVGKTTLLRILAQDLKPSKGVIRLGYQVQIGYYAQHQADALHMEKTILQELESAAVETKATADLKALAGAFLFSGDAVYKKCGVLSGGERARVALAKLLLQPVNFLLLDEPTNHLDVVSRDVLLNALLDFNGTLCLVSHDRGFMRPLVTSVLEIKPNEGHGAEVDHLVEDYDGYLARITRQITHQKAKNPKVESEKQVTPVQTKHTPPRKLLSKITKAEENVSRIEKRLSEIQHSLTDPDIYSNRDKTLELLNQQKRLQEELETAVDTWEKAEKELTDFHSK